MTLQKVVVDTDVLIDHLTHVASSKQKGDPSVLRKATGMFFCYTTVFSAIELFSNCKNERERQAVEDSMHALKVLGLNSKSAKNIGMMMERTGKSNRGAMELLIAGLCMETKLPLLTGRVKRYRKVSGLKIIPANAMRRYHTAEEVLRHSL